MKIAREDEVEIVKELQNRMGTKELTAIDFMDQIFIAFHVCDINIKVAQMNMSTRETKVVMQIAINKIALELLDTECIIKRDIKNEEGKIVTMVKLTDKILKFE